MVQRSLVCLLFLSLLAGCSADCGPQEMGEQRPDNGAWIGLSASEHHTCAVRDTGRVACWG
ncbi:MAG: RCC1 domain-containing protein, partial [candidate division NC10 bacterium]